MPSGHCATPEAEAEKSRKLREHHKGGFPTGEANPAKRPEVRAKISVALKGKPKSLEMRARVSASEKGRPKPGMAAYYQTEGGLRKRFLQRGNFYFRIPRWKRLWRKFLWRFWYRSSWRGE